MLTIPMPKFDLELPNFGQVITTHMASLLSGFVSMETALTFDPKCFIKITVFAIFIVSFFFLKPTVEYHNSLLKIFAFNTLLILCENKTKSECLHGKRN